MFRLFKPFNDVLLPFPVEPSRPPPEDEKTKLPVTTGLPYPLDTLHASGLWPNYNYASGNGSGGGASSSDASSRCGFCGGAGAGAGAGAAAASSSSSSGGGSSSSSSSGGASSSSSNSSSNLSPRDRDAEREWLEIIKVYRTVGKILNVMMRGGYPVPVHLANPLGTIE